MIAGNITSKKVVKEVSSSNPRAKNKTKQQSAVKSKGKSKING